MKATSPVERFKGHVILPDFLTVHQVRQFEDAYFGDLNEVSTEGQRVFISVSDAKMLPLILDIVQEWHIKDIPENPSIDDIPMTPAKDGHALVKWLSGELYQMYTGEKQVPNE